MCGLDIYSFIGWTICFFIFIFEGSYMVYAKNKSNKNDEIYAEYRKDKNRNNGYNLFIKNSKKINDEYVRKGQQIPIIRKYFLIISVTIFCCIVIKVIFQYFNVLSFIVNEKTRGFLSDLLPIFLILLSNLIIGIIARKDQSQKEYVDSLINYSSIYYLISSAIGLLLIDWLLSATAVLYLLGYYLFFKRFEMRELLAVIKRYFISLEKVNSFEALVCRELALMNIESFFFVLCYKMVVHWYADINPIMLVCIMIVISVSALFAYDGGLLNGWRLKLDAQKSEVNEWIDKEREQYGKTKKQTLGKKNRNRKKHH